MTNWQGEGFIPLIFNSFPFFFTVILKDFQAQRLRSSAVAVNPILLPSDEFKIDFVSAAEAGAGATA